MAVRRSRRWLIAAAARGLAANRRPGRRLALSADITQLVVRRRQTLGGQPIGDCCPAVANALLRDQARVDEERRPKRTPCAFFTQAPPPGALTDEPALELGSIVAQSTAAPPLLALTPRVGVYDRPQDAGADAVG